MFFSYKKSESIIPGKLKYVDEDKSISFIAKEAELDPLSHGDSAALVVSDTLQVEFLLENGRLLYVWGYLPRESWQERSENFQLDKVVSGEVFVHDVDDPLTTGAGYSSSLKKSPSIFYGSGHLVIGNPTEADLLIEIAADSIIGLSGDQLCALILKPVTGKA